MPISPDKIRELAARPEGTNLDFKVCGYDWDNDGNFELSKDLMAMANCLLPNSEPAYILCGVRPNEIVGVTPENHLDDASFHQKVSGHLNQTPTFVYAPVQVDDKSVGVFEIRPGSRPFYPLKDHKPKPGKQQKLWRYLAMYRNGSATEPASPDMIVGWAREDDPTAHRVRSLELAKLEAEAAVRARLYSTAVSTSDGIRVDLEIENQSLSDVSVGPCVWRARWNAKFTAQLAKDGGTIPDGYKPPSGEFDVRAAGILKPGHKQSFKFVWTRQEALNHLNAAGIRIAGFSGDWAEYDLTVYCNGALGGTGMALWTVRP